ncbi:hypothetical protein GLOIN_2v1836057 [Rhizophagus irregularis DAOM 181602=DAOM 197198]|nr:hypothetical protein GLOIN_2v1836057 [Rhizophagus irregularis DAOM 181602=DAOM 197198]
MRNFFNLKISVKLIQKSVEKSRQESHKQTSSQEFVSSDSPKQTSISKQQSAASGSGSTKTQKQASKQQSAASGSVSTKTQKQTSIQESAASASGSGTTKTQKQTSIQESAASGSSSTKIQKQTSIQESAASGFGSTKTQKQTSIPEASEDNGPFRLVVPSSLYSQQSRMVPPICNVTVHRELTPITRTAEPYRSNVHRELTPITRTGEPYRINIHRELTPITRTTEPYRSNVRIAEPYRRESTPIIREPYSSNWTRDVNETYDLREENAYLRGRIDELNRQLDNANGELRDLRLDVGQLQSYNNILSQENDGLRHRHSSDLQDIEFEEDQRPTKRGKGKNLVRDSEDEMEVDEEEARAEMKTILKTFPIELELIYDEKFSSESNDEILRQIIPRLIEAMKPRVRLLYKQRGTLDKDNRRLHRNNRLNEKKARRVKGAKSLFDKNDEKLENYDRKELLNVLSDNRYHSPEYSESDEEQPDGKRHINVYNPSWRSEED